MSNELSDYILDICTRSKNASRTISKLTTNERNNALLSIASKLRVKADYIIEQNTKDLKAADEACVPKALRDRLLLNRDRINGMAAAIEEIAKMEDPIGKIESMSTRPSGIKVGQMRVPIGVIAVIFESRPNVTTDIAALTLKSGNASILRGGRESINSNMALYSVIKEALKEASLPEDSVILIERAEHEAVTALLKMNTHIDIVIPRGGEGLIKMVSEESRIPVIKHDKGVCHTFIDQSASSDMAVNISINAKVQRPGVCNAMETLLIHKDFPDKIKILEALLAKGVEIRGCKQTVELLPGKITPADDKDWDTEYLDLILAVKIASSFEDAMDHIYKYSSNHSEAIVTSEYANAERFLKEVDSSAVFVNSSTRFHDGGEFGLGAEVGISTQKLHARGAMGLSGLTCLKYVIYGSGQVRN